MPEIPPLQDENISLNSWLEQTTRELNVARNEIEELQSDLTAALARITALEPTP